MGPCGLQEIGVWSRGLSHTTPSSHRLCDPVTNLPTGLVFHGPLSQFIMLPTLPLNNVTKKIVSTPFKRSQLGLFQGKTKLTGNSVPFSKHKTRRTWLPNVQKKRFFSDTLGKDVTVNVTVRALRTIRKVNTSHRITFHFAFRVF